TGNKTNWSRALKSHHQAVYKDYKLHKTSLIATKADFKLLSVLCLANQYYA
ncbi:zinc finger protein, partial [Clarias magur]